MEEGAWATLYGTIRRPFNKPKRKKIAVKVINHHGDGVVKVSRSTSEQDSHLNGHRMTTCEISKF